jgi:redox-sensitive bicupin YhaK (pirin superfamily)
MQTQVDPFFTMLWNEDVPKLSSEGVDVAVVSGSYIAGTTPAEPPRCPPHSWAAQPGSSVGIVTVKLQPGASWHLPATAKGLNRAVYFFVGSKVEVGDQSIAPRTKVDVQSDSRCLLKNVGPDVAEFLVLEGKPIGEPVVQHGPFVMNSRDQIIQAFSDYQRTEFGKWPWSSDAPAHARDKPRFAKYPDGREEVPTAGGGSTVTGGSGAASS